MYSFPEYSFSTVLDFHPFSRECAVSPLLTDKDIKKKGNHFTSFETQDLP